MKKLFFTLIFLGCFTSFFAQGKIEQIFRGETKPDVEQLEIQKEKVEEKEKESLRKEVMMINKLLKEEKLSMEEADEQKRVAATKHARNIKDQLQILDAHIDLIKRNADADYEVLYAHNDKDEKIKMDTLTSTFKFHRTYGSLIIGFGFSNAKGDGFSLGDRYRVAGSRYFEMGFEWSTGLIATNFLRFNYGVLLQFDGFKPKQTHQYFVLEEDQVVLHDFEGKLKKAKLRRNNLIVPLHLEIGSTDNKGYSNNFRLGLGGFLGLNLSTVQKLKYKNAGHRVKEKNRFNSQAEDLVYGWSGYLGYKGTTLVIRYATSPIFKHNDIEEEVVAVGVRWTF